MTTAARAAAARRGRVACCHWGWSEAGLTVYTSRPMLDGGRQDWRHARTCRGSGGWARFSRSRVATDPTAWRRRIRSPSFASLTNCRRVLFQVMVDGATAFEWRRRRQFQSQGVPISAHWSAQPPAGHPRLAQCCSRYDQTWPSVYIRLDRGLSAADVRRCGKVDRAADGTMKSASSAACATKRAARHAPPHSARSRGCATAPRLTAGRRPRRRRAWATPRPRQRCCAGRRRLRPPDSRI